MKKILFVHTRELCYYSGRFFLQQMAAACRNLGADTEFMALETMKDFEGLEQRMGEDFAAIIDINSKLPYVIRENGEPLLDDLGAPFYNYIVDHPLYHHPGLVFPLKDYHVLGIDRRHCLYMQQYYPHLQQVSFLPLGATASAKQIPYEKRRIPLLVSCTYEEEEKKRREFHQLCQKLTGKKNGGDLCRLGEELMELMSAGQDGGEIAMEDALKMLLDPQDLLEGRYVTTEFPVLMNYLYLVDKYVRNVRRRRVMEYVLSLNIPVTIMGEGWEPLVGKAKGRVTCLGARRLEESFAIMADSRRLLDINPLFPQGVHDRVTTGMMNGALVFSDMSPEADPGMQQDRQLCYYSVRNLDSLGEMLLEMDPAAQQQIAGQGCTYVRQHYSWQAQGQELLKIIGA